MLQRAIDFVNTNPAIMAGVMCLIGATFMVVYAIEGKNRRKMRSRIRQLKEAVETKETLIVHKDAEIQRLKVDLFRAREDGKIALRKKQAEVDRLTARVAQLEQDKKQLTKWGAEK